MKTLIYFLPETEGHAHGSYNDFAVGGDTLRIIYYKEKMNFLSFILFKRKISAYIKGASMYACDIAKRLRGDIIWRDGYALATYYIKQIVFTAVDSTEKSNIAVFSTNPQDISALAEIIRECDIKILTMSDMAHVYNKIIHEEFGLVECASGALPMQGKTVIIMPGGEIFDAEGAENIVNLSKAEIPWRCISPLSVRYALPACFKGCSRVLSQSDALQTAMDFFGISYDKTRVISVKTDKE